MNDTFPAIENFPWPAAYPRIVAVGPQYPLAEVAAAAILARFLPEGAAPESLTQILILVPTRRAARSLREAMLRQSGGKPLLLPRIQPLGEAAEDEVVFAQLLSNPESAAKLLAMPPAMEPAERALRMTELLKKLDRDLPLEQTAKLALSLLDVLDDCQRYGCAPEKLADIVPEALAMHWQKVLQVLNVIWNFWPGIVAESGKMDPVLRRDALLALLQEHWDRMPPGHPVIAIGTFGTQSAARKLLGAVARLPDSAILLSGVEESLPDEAWESLDSTHHAHAVKELLADFNESRAGLIHWPAENDSARLRLWQEALLPAEQTERWRDRVLNDVEFTQSVSGLHRILAPHRAAEAQAIAMLLREVLETPGKTGALVTPDRSLGMQVQAHLAALGVTIDDSAGMPLLRTPAGRFLQLTMDAAYAGFAPVPLLSLLRHPFCQAGMKRVEWLRLTRLFEIHCLRGLRPSAGLQNLRDALHAPRERPLADVLVSELSQWLDVLFAALAPLDHLFTQAAESPSLSTYMDQHLAAANALATDEEGELRLWSQPESMAITRALDHLRRASTYLADIKPENYPPLLVVLLAGDAWRPSYAAHPRLQILSPQEARLQRFDRLILGGLNEGVWPNTQESGPWLSRPMRETAGLGLTEESLGRQALDFFHLAMAPEVFLTLSAKQGTSAALPSRYLQRLDAVLQAYGDTNRIDRPDVLNWVEQMTQWSGVVLPEKRPEPTPPLGARPRALSVTSIDKLLKDPYGLYASHILSLKELDGFDTEPQAAELGLMLHKIMEDLTTEFPGGWSDDIPARFDALAHAQLATWQAYPLLQIMARERIAALREWLLALDKERRAESQRIQAEQKISHRWMSSGGEFTLSARVDRMELHADGMRLVDYKSGNLPKLSDMAEGRSNQLPLQGWMARQGAVPGQTHAVMEFWQIKASDAEEAVKSLEDMCSSRSKHKTTAAELIEQAGTRVQGVIAAYDQASTAYVAAFLPANASYGLEYAHLARQGEWE